MPSLTIHLLVAYKFNPNGTAEFFAGSVAPDAVRSREDKDRTHMRDMPNEMRPAALRALAKRLDLSDSIILGALLHLYTDYFWDTTLQAQYIKSYGEGWFLPYREQISVAGAWIYHNNPEIKRVWKLIADAVNGGLTIDVGAVTCSLFRSGCDKRCGIDCGDARGLILRNYKWNIDNYTGPSAAFTPEAVDRFASDTAESFKAFLHNK